MRAWDARARLCGAGALAREALAQSLHRARQETRREEIPRSNTSYDLTRVFRRRSARATPDATARSESDNRRRLSVQASCLRGLAETARDSRPEIPDGIFLVRIDGAQFRWHAHKPFYVLRLSVIEPRTLAGQPIVGRLYCTQKAMWKLGWFLRDFLYDPELLAHEQVDEKALPGLRGVVKISHTVINGISLINLDGFAPASQWEELSATPVSSTSRSNPAEASR